MKRHRHRDRVAGINRRLREPAFEIAQWGSTMKVEADGSLSITPPSDNPPTKVPEDFFVSHPTERITQ